MLLKKVIDLSYFYQESFSVLTWFSSKILILLMFDESSFSLCIDLEESIFADYCLTRKILSIISFGKKIQLLSDVSWVLWRRLGSSFIFWRALLGYPMRFKQKCTTHAHWIAANVKAERSIAKDRGATHSYIRLKLSYINYSLSFIVLYPTKEKLQTNQSKTPQTCHRTV